MCPSAIPPMATSIGPSQSLHCAFGLVDARIHDGACCWLVASPAASVQVPAMVIPPRQSRNCFQLLPLSLPDHHPEPSGAGAGVDPLAPAPGEAVEASTLFDGSARDVVAELGALVAAAVLGEAQATVLSAPLAADTACEAMTLMTAVLATRASARRPRPANRRPPPGAEVRCESSRLVTVLVLAPDRWHAQRSARVEQVAPVR